MSACRLLGLGKEKFKVPPEIGISPEDGLGVEDVPRNFR